MPFSKCSSHPSIVSTEATSLCMPYRADQQAGSQSTGANNALCWQLEDPGPFGVSQAGVQHFFIPHQ